MKKGIKILMSFLIVTLSLQTIRNSTVEVEASGNYPLYCGSQYELSTANKNGTFTKINCYNSFNEAQDALKSSGDDAVVRHSSSLSPMKVVSMNSGLAITYPMRLDSTTLDVYQDINHTYRKKTYVTKHREMKYDKTYSYNGNGDGTILINITGFSGTVSLKGVDLVPHAFIQGDNAVWLGGNDVTSAKEQPFLTHIYQSYYVVQQNGNYKDLVYIAHSGWSGASTYPAKYSLTVGPAADWMNVGERFYSYDGYTFYSDHQYKNQVGVYYNYYQFLPARSQTGISADVMNNYLISIKGSGTNSKMKNEGQAFINAQNKYGVNALLVYALACLESAYGTSYYALNRNNLFGWNAYDSAPGMASYFPSIPAAIDEHMGINLRGYLNIDDARFFGSHVGNKGSGFNVKYASDPYWGYKIAAIAYDVDKYANGYNGRLTDDKKVVGLINTYGVDIKKTVNGDRLFNSKYGATYQENFTVAILSEDNNWVKIQSTNPVVNGNIVTGTTKGLVTYDWNASVGYIQSNYITKFSSTDANIPIGEEPTGDFIEEVNKVVLDGNKMIISGQAYRPGIHVTEENKVSQELVIMDENGNETQISAKSTVTESMKVSYSGEVDLSSLDIGQYYFKLATKYSKLVAYSEEFVLKYSGKYPEAITLDGKLITISESSEYLTVSVVKAESEKPTEVEKILKQEVLSYGYNDKENKLEITGYAFISGMDAKETTAITQKVTLYNMETEERIEFDVESISLLEPLMFNDGYEYTKVKYEAVLKMTDVPPGNYTMYVSVKNGDTEKKAELKNYYYQTKPQDFEMNSYQVRFIINQMYGYRYEIQIEKSDLDISLINKPTARNSVFDFSTLAIENKGLKIEGVSWIYGADSNQATNPQYQLVFVDSSGATTEKDLLSKSCEIDYTNMLKLKFDTSKACFSGEIDLGDMKSENYRMYLKIETGKYMDTFELYDFYNRDIPSVSDLNRQYAISNSKVRKRLNLTIEDK